MRARLLLSRHFSPAAICEAAHAMAPVTEGRSGGVAAATQRELLADRVVVARRVDQFGCTFDMQRTFVQDSNDRSFHLNALKS